MIEKMRKLCKLAHFLFNKVIYSTIAFPNGMPSINV